MLFRSDDFSAFDVIILVGDFPQYRLVSQEFIDRRISGQVSLVIDDHGIWSDYRFSEPTTYHQVGDGALDLMG